VVRMILEHTPNPSQEGNQKIFLPYRRRSFDGTGLTSSMKMEEERLDKPCIQDGITLTLFGFIPFKPSPQTPLPIRERGKVQPDKNKILIGVRVEFPSCEPVPSELWTGGGNEWVSVTL
jgi:hypothetical protein